MLEVEHLVRNLNGCRLEDVSFSVNAGEYFVLLGKSGSGKSSILEMIAGLLKPDKGVIRLEGRDITNSPPQSRRIGIVYQDQSLFPHMTVRQNIFYALSGYPRKESERILDLLGISSLMERSPLTLSSGEAQRVALSRALVRNPKLLLLDEPLVSVDASSRRTIRSLLRAINRQGQTIVHVTHDYEEAIALASRVGVIEDGRITQVGRPDEVFTTPRSEFVASFAELRNFYRGFAKRTDTMCVFETNGLAFQLPDDAPTGAGYAVIRNDAVVVSASRPSGSARNAFHGTVTELESSRNGIEVTLDIGVPIHALITRSACRELALSVGQKAWVCFKANSVAFAPEE